MCIELSVSVVLYKNSTGEVKKWLNSVAFLTSAKRIFVVDNSPTNVLASEFTNIPDCDYIHLPNNPGYGTGHNIAINKSNGLNGSYHLIINADVSFDCDVIAPMIKYMDAHQDVGLMMPKVLNPDGSIQRLCKLVPTPLDLLFRRFIPSGFGEKRNKLFEMHQSGYDKIMFVPYLSGCFMLIRHSALRDVGGFDERFFMYPEDIDLTRRIAEKYETLYFPLVSVTHQHGAASYKSLRMLFIHVFNICKYFTKWGWIRDQGRDELNIKATKNFKI